jgi:HSP90 family molecular chaperone
MEPGVSLFSRKVLIQQKCKGLLPEWLRFIKGISLSIHIDIRDEETDTLSSIVDRSA